MGTNNNQGSQPVTRYGALDYAAALRQYNMYASVFPHSQLKTSD